ncbi:MAG TPA: DEAD/DEAH box helicase [Flavobacteriaceae bacterium]|jgi:superfamily II DNA/RNA helicase|nr:helicase [Flavobacteriaceae bacterium]MAY53969.1 helicase [Flavobacteriaceae bacterium]HBR54668.1 helicase [Flavobacteriaceae bacterium]HIB47887.1 DEAD/DEAH box helicase [Flavobacteriaceae bacterium]HIN99383.1 DEAD/DEAH box helicase [Flavobacteriaceae bacterium]|tara:strand:- start:120545 stop:121843 length:1299 start_codon:yes stop_codon:yes gene_type:complete
MKTQQEILEKLQIEALNPMQEEAHLAISNSDNVILLSPTGTGKTLAFLLPLLKSLDPENESVQLLILVPSRELAIQIEQVLREMGSGLKTNAVYGGRPFSKDKIDLAHAPAILIGTPGRVADHLRRETFLTTSIKTLVLDEFDKSLEVGFEKEMKEIIGSLRQLKKRVLTSATHDMEVPSFVGLTNEVVINYLEEGLQNLKVKKVLASEKNKLNTLVLLLQHIGNEPGIIFCNFKDTIQYVSDYLTDNNISHGCFYGGMEQKDRERALIQFRNGTHQIIIATDLAARGLDIPELTFIIHYQLPIHKEEFTHRNGRTARMNAHGTAYVLQWTEEYVPEFITTKEIVALAPKNVRLETNWTTLFVSGGRKDKISKGDIAGLFFKQGGLNKNELGLIELKQDCAFVAVPKSKAHEVIRKTNNTRLKKKKVRISLL